MMGACSGMKEDTCNRWGQGSRGCIENRGKRGKDYWGEKRTGKAFAKWLKVCSYKKTADRDEAAA